MELFLVILIIAVIASLPVWGYSRNWGYRPGGILGIIFLVLFVWFLMHISDINIDRDNGKTTIEIERYGN